MTKYANKTCYKCGIILPQPEMNQIQISEDAGHSTSIFGNTNKKAWGGVRFYTRKKNVWVRKKCNGSTSLGIIGLILFFTIILLFFI